MIPIDQFEKLLEDTEQELIVLRKDTYSGVMSFLEKEAEEAIRAVIHHEHKEWDKWTPSSNNTYEIQLAKLLEKRESTIKTLNEWKDDPTLASKSLENEISMKENIIDLIQAEKEKIKAEAAMIEALQIKSAKFQTIADKIKAATAEAIAAEAATVEALQTKTAKFPIAVAEIEAAAAKEIAAAVAEIEAAAAEEIAVEAAMTEVETA